MKHYIGVDIGLSGGISLLSESGSLLICEPMPIIKTIVNKKNRPQYDIQNINGIIKAWISDYHIAMAGMERLRAIPNQSSQTGFSLGAGSMLFKTLFTVHGIPFTEMEPITWQKHIFVPLGIQFKIKLEKNATKDRKREAKKATKIASIQAAKQLFPSTCFKANSRCRVDHDGMTDSANIGLFIVQNFK